MFLYGFKIIKLYDNERIDKCFLGTSYSSGTVLHILVCSGMNLYVY